MASKRHIVHHAGRFWAGLPPDAATYILAVLDNPHGLIVALTFALSTLASELLKMSVVAIVGRYIWPRLPSGVRRFLQGAWGLVWPWAGARDQDLHQDQSAEIAELKARVRELESRFESLPVRHPDDPADSMEISIKERNEG